LQPDPEKQQSAGRLPEHLCDRGEVQGVDVCQAGRSGNERDVLAEERHPAARAEPEHLIRSQSGEQRGSLKKMLQENPMHAIGKLLRSAMLLATFMVVASSAALALFGDRPGTPTEFTIFNCFHSPSVKPYICGSFKNAATEDVRFEMEWVQEG